MESGSITRRYARAPRPAAGFTLIELLVVVVIIGIVITFAVLSVGANEGHELKEQAKRLTGLIELAHEEAILDARELAVQFKDGGYQFYAQGDDGTWSVWDDKSGPFHAGQFPPGIKMDLTIDGQDASDQTGVASMLPDGADEKKKPKAMVYILSSGELTPFELSLHREDQGGYKITGTINGDVSMKRYDNS